MQYDPRMLEDVHSQTPSVLDRKNALPRKIKESVIMGVNAATCWLGVASHIDCAFKSGVIPVQTTEVLEVESIYSHGPRMFTPVFGETALDRVSNVHHQDKIGEVVYDKLLFDKLSEP